MSKIIDGWIAAIKESQVNAFSKRDTSEWAEMVAAIATSQI
jgi:hypothetical protein